MSAIELNMQELLQNQQVSQVEDMPDLLTLANGTYLLKGISIKPGESTKHNPKVGVTMEVVEVQELSKAEQEAGVTAEDFPVGTLCHFTFSDKEPEKVLSRLKKPFGETMESNGMATFAELIEQFDQLTFVCQCTRRKAPDFSEDNPNYFGQLELAVIA